MREAIRRVAGEWHFKWAFLRTSAAQPSRSRRQSALELRLCVPKTSSVLIAEENRITSATIVALLCFFLALLASPFRSISLHEAENAALRHQLMVLQRKVLGRVHFTKSDRLFFIHVYRGFPW